MHFPSVDVVLVNVIAGPKRVSLLSWTKTGQCLLNIILPAGSDLGTRTHHRIQTRCQFPKLLPDRLRIRCGLLLPYYVLLRWKFSICATIRYYRIFICMVSKPLSHTVYVSCGVAYVKVFGICGPFSLSLDWEYFTHFIIISHHVDILIVPRYILYYRVYVSNICQYAVRLSSKQLIIVSSWITYTYAL